MTRRQADTQDPLTSGPTVERDLGKRPSAQRFPGGLLTRKRSHGADLDRCVRGRQRDIQKRTFLRYPPLPRHSASGRRPKLVSEINVAPPALPQGSATLPHMGTSARLCPRLHRRPAAAASGRRPGACRLLSGVHRDRQRRPQRPAHPPATPGPAPPQRHPGRLETRPPRPARCGIWSTPSPASPTAASGPQPPGGNRHHHPRRQAGVPCLRRPGRVRTRWRRLPRRLG
jgi:hypothetical protein